MRTNLTHPEYFHVTERLDAHEIIKAGFLGGWGDAGYGVYAFDNIVSATEYASKGGWDSRLADPVILVFSDSTLTPVIPEPSWPNPEDYASIYWREMDESDEDECWMPRNIEIIEVPAAKRPLAKPA